MGLPILIEDLSWRHNIMQRQGHSKKQIKSRYHKVLFNNGSPFGHRVETDKSKQIPRKDKYKKINIDIEEE